MEKGNKFSSGDGSLAGERDGPLKGRNVFGGKKMNRGGSNPLRGRRPVLLKKRKQILLSIGIPKKGNNSSEGGDTIALGNGEANPLS